VKCIWCREHEATEDMYCPQCNDYLEMWDKARLNNSFEAACWRLGKETEVFKQAVRASLPRWLKWLVRT
jgi:hypothetical protein